MTRARRGRPGARSAVSPRSANVGAGGGPGDGGDGDAGCAVVTVAGTLTADSSLVPGSNLNYGAQPIVNVSAAQGTVGLFRFRLPVLPTGRSPVAGRLILTYAARSTMCAANCGSCATIDQAGNLALFFMRSDWNETQANAMIAATGTPWGAPTAGQAGVDHSVDPARMVVHRGQTSETFAFAAAALVQAAVWTRNGELSFQLQASNGAAFVLATKETASEACGTYAPPRLELDYCP